VERRAKSVYGNDYDPIPNDADLKIPLIEEIRRNDLSASPSCVVGLRGGRLWPVVFLNKVQRAPDMANNLLFPIPDVYTAQFNSFIVAIPLVEAWLSLPSSINSSGTLGASIELPRHLFPESLREMRKRSLADLYELARPSNPVLRLPYCTDHS
jgi:hypothetical protein